MMDETIVSTLLLAATDDPSFLAALLAQVWLWLKVAIGIGLVIFVHELGHFAAAKTFGVKCEKFYVGFDVPMRIGPIKLPRTLGKIQFGETEYGIGILPLGGYVKMLGQDDDPRRAEEEAERIRVATGDPDAKPVLDPRSYPAKPVWQRMVIISAGVVMNVVTGVLFAAIAYGIGVTYTPAVVGGVTPAGPAWQAGIEPGGRVIAVGSLPEDDQLHFVEMRNAIVTEGLDAPKEPVKVLLRYGDEVRQYDLKTQPLPGQSDLRMIGVSMPDTPLLAESTVAVPASVAADVLTADDRKAAVVSFNDTAIDLDTTVPIIPLLNELYAHPDKPIQLVLKRTDNSQRTVEIPPQPAKSLGIRFAIGPITALVEGGPAQTAGVLVGDVITAIDGNQDVDAYTLALQPITSTSPVTLTIRRGEGADAETLDLELTPVPATLTRPAVSELSSEVASTSLGLAYEVSSQVAAVDRDATSASAAELPADLVPLEPGDVIRRVVVIWPDDEPPARVKEQFSDAAVDALSTGWEFDTEHPLTTFLETIQMFPIGTEVRIFARRPSSGVVVKSVATVRESDRFWHSRGLVFQSSESVQTADSLGQAVALGWREGKRRLGDVARFLGLLTRGRVKPRHVGGPVRIVQLAGAQAEKGVSQQLLFLTMLSMNLAILNFLPIPALDGGHMVFLTYELVRGKKVDEQIEMRLTLAGVLALIALMVFVFANDLIHI